MDHVLIVDGQDVVNMDNLSMHQKMKMGEISLTQYRRWCNGQDINVTKTSAVYLGIHVAETILANIFKDVTKMPANNPGYDFICKNGFKIDVKSACLTNSIDYSWWPYTIARNKGCDYFLLIGFDNREQLNPLHIWLIKSDLIINEQPIQNKAKLVITNTSHSLARWLQYELTGKLDEAIIQCNKLRSGCS